MRQLTNQRGDTLVEVILALIILSTVLVTSISLGRLSNIAGTNARTTTQSSAAMQEQYEALRSYRDRVGWTQFVAGIDVRFLGSKNCSDDTGWGGTTSSTFIYCFHMERDGRATLGGLPNPDYGEWVPCPGSIKPSFDTYDWKQPLGYTPPNPAFPWCKTPDDLVQQQQLTRIFIYTDQPFADGLPPCGQPNLRRYGRSQQPSNHDDPAKQEMSFTIVGPSVSAGLNNAQGNTITTKLVDLKGAPTGVICP